ncbi:hypothetical protein E1265_26070 [Streptomyces sp. 8K308]|uniref:hypothetical protein n=1 Tax=Streptomyces sp. 8K308 TaxID=2530388 RepID=UPI0010487024|nr:hypothetical protein [Streptomyces sp. 8K308]TDC15880.1 hypothetical protein E1265_26070 [Streptomyces sp. 8K308]
MFQPSAVPEDGRHATSQGSCLPLLGFQPTAALADGRHVDRLGLAGGVLVVPTHGGTAAAVARHARYTGSALKICVPDPEHSAYFNGRYWPDPTITDKGSHIEGIGHPTSKPPTPTSSPSTPTQP